MKKRFIVLLVLFFLLLVSSLIIYKYVNQYFSVAAYENQLAKNIGIDKLTCPSSEKIICNGGICINGDCGQFDHIPKDQPRQYCNSEYQDWIKKNCTKVKIELDASGQW
jgi:hypothetical protein